MDLGEFIHLYDREDIVVLLEGKREVLPGDRGKLTLLASLLTRLTDKMIFRSGNAMGSDELFSLGVTKINPKRFQVIAPYSGHRSRANQAGYTLNLDEINIAEEDEVVYQSGSNKRNASLITEYVAGHRNKLAMKGAYLIRDTIKVIGVGGLKPADFGLFYDDLQNPGRGGTGHTMSICRQNGIPFVDQRVWFSWLTESES